LSASIEIRFLVSKMVEGLNGLIKWLFNHSTICLFSDKHPARSQQQRRSPVAGDAIVYPICKIPLKKEN
jgi:hypothetical protein